jgi:hypothetical protein
MLLHDDNHEKSPCVNLWLWMAFFANAPAHRDTIVMTAYSGDAEEYTPSN